MAERFALRRRLRTLFERPEPALYYLLVVLLLACAATAVRAIPSAGEWGVDVKNLYVFHHCALRDTPYDATGAQCGDPWKRGLNYPPFLYWSFAWMRWTSSFPLARGLWAAVTALMLLWVPSRWSVGSTRVRRWLVCLFGAALAVQFPGVFAIERGNTDIVVVAGWTVALGLSAEWPVAAGFMLGTLALFKVYPAIGGAVLGAGLVGAVILGPSAERRAALRLGGGMALGLVVLGLAFFKQNRQYFRDVLPRFATGLPGPSMFSHSVPSTLREPAMAAKLVSGALLLVWSVVAFLRFRRAPRDIFAGSLAVSTYVAATSYDYNLTTVYPLFLVLLQRGLEPRKRPSWGAWVALASGILVMVADWSWFPKNEQLRVELQVVWLGLVAVLLAVSLGRAGRHQGNVPSAAPSP